MTSPYGFQVGVAIVTGGSRGTGKGRGGGSRGGRSPGARDPRPGADGRRATRRYRGHGRRRRPRPSARAHRIGPCAPSDGSTFSSATPRPTGPPAPLIEAGPERRREAFTVGVEALLRLAQCIRRAWTGERGGTVVDNCTQSGGPADPNVGDHGTGKAALLHPTRHLAGELAPKVRVTPPGSSARRRPDRSGRTARTPSPQGCRSAASAGSRTSPAPCSGRRRTRPTGSPAPTCRATAEPGPGPRTSRSPPPPGRTPSGIDCAHVRRIGSDVTGVTSFVTTGSKGGGHSREQCDPDEDQ